MYNMLFYFWDLTHLMQWFFFFFILLSCSSFCDFVSFYSNFCFSVITESILSPLSLRNSTDRRTSMSPSPWTLFFFFFCLNESFIFLCFHVRFLFLFWSTWKMHLEFCCFLFVFPERYHFRLWLSSAWRCFIYLRIFKCILFFWERKKNTHVFFFRVFLSFTALVMYS